jgi:iron-sulfur cluster repair protein YtfE (RIC family)
MDPGKARSQLLREHEVLRALLSEALAIAAQLRGLEPVHAALERAVDALRRAFARHNQSEEALLAPILRVDPAWGPARIARMLEEHSAEHGAFRAMLDGTSLEVAARLPDLADDLDAHMAAEERTFLSPGVLRS